MDASLAFPVLVGLIAVALLFDFLNGLHDAANSIATIVSTRVLRPQYAVAWAAFFNFIAFAVFGLHVAQTIGTGIIHPEVIDAQVIFAALIGAIMWNVITWALGMPSSSSHALDRRIAGSRCSQGRNLRHRLERAVEDAARHRAVAADWISACAAADGDRVLGLGAFDAVCGRSRLPDSPVRFRLAVLARARRQ